MQPHNKLGKLPPCDQLLASLQKLVSMHSACKEVCLELNDAICST